MKCENPGLHCSRDQHQPEDKACRPRKCRHTTTDNSVRLRLRANQGVQFRSGDHLL